MTLSTTVPPIPTSFHARTEGLKVPVAAIDDPEAQALLEALGLETVVWSDETRLYWDEATLELRLERMMVDVEGSAAPNCPHVLQTYRSPCSRIPRTRDKWPLWLPSSSTHP